MLSRLKLCCSMLENRAGGIARIGLATIDSGIACVGPATNICICVFSYFLRDRFEINCRERLQACTVEPTRYERWPRPA